MIDRRGVIASIGTWITAAGPVAALAVADGGDRGPPLPALGTRLVLPAVTQLDGRNVAPTDFDGQVLVLTGGPAGARSARCRAR